MSSQRGTTAFELGISSVLIFLEQEMTRYLQAEAAAAWCSGIAGATQRQDNAATAGRLMAYLLQLRGWPKPEAARAVYNQVYCLCEAHALGQQIADRDWLAVGSAGLAVTEALYDQDRDAWIGARMATHVAWAMSLKPSPARSLPRDIFPDDEARAAAIPYLAEEIITAIEHGTWR